MVIKLSGSVVGGDIVCMTSDTGRLPHCSREVNIPRLSGPNWSNERAYNQGDQYQKACLGRRLYLLQYLSVFGDEDTGVKN